MLSAEIIVHSSHREWPISSFISSECLQRIWVWLVYTSPSPLNFRNCLTAMTQLQFASLPSFFIKTLHTTLWGSSLVWMPRECKGTVLIWNNSYTHTQKKSVFLTNQVKVQSCVFSSICIFEKNHSLCYEGPFVLIFFKFSSLFCWGEETCVMFFAHSVGNCRVIL